MAVFKKIMNVLGIIISLFLSLILIIVLLATPAIAGLSSFFKAENLSKVVSSIDFNQVLFGENGMSPEMGEYSQLIEGITQTEMMEDFLDLYIKDVMGTLEGSAEKHLTTQAVLEVVNEHMDEMLSLMKESLGPAAELLSDEDLKQYVLMAFEANADSVLAMFPTLADLGLDEQILEGIHLLGSGMIVVVMIVVIGILSLLILLCRWVRYEGFMWLGVVYVLSAIVVFLASFGIGSAGVIPVSVAGTMAGLVEPVLSILSAELFKGAGIFAGLAVVFIIIFVIGRKIVSKKA